MKPSGELEGLAIPGAEMGNVAALNNIKFDIRATVSNAHRIGIMMGASVIKEGNKLVIMRNDLMLEVPLGHWLVLQGGNAQVQELKPVAI